MLIVVLIFKLAMLIPIDLVIGVIPFDENLVKECSRKALTLDCKESGSRSFGHQFAYFNHALNLVRNSNPAERQVFFLLAATAPAIFPGRELISDLLMVKPVTVAVKQQTSVSRCCYFWSNIPGVNR